MIKSFIDAWNIHKDELEEYFKTTPMEEYMSYGSLVALVFDKVVNPEREYPFNIEKITIIDDGDYQGTQIFVIPIDAYQPTICDYVHTNTYYGSCSGCDTLQAIHCYMYDDLPSEKQVKSYMTLCLHLLEKCCWMVGEEDHDNCC